MFVYEKKLQYPIKIKNTNPKLAAAIISQYGGPYINKLQNSEVAPVGTASLFHIISHSSRPPQERIPAGSCRSPQKRIPAGGRCSAQKRIATAGGDAGPRCAATSLLLPLDHR